MIGCRGGGEHMKIEVRGTGPGIPPDMREAVFQEYQRLPQSESQGLRLAIVERIARMLAQRAAARKQVS